MSVYKQLVSTHVKSLNQSVHFWGLRHVPSSGPPCSGISEILTKPHNTRATTATLSTTTTKPRPSAPTLNK